MHYKKDLLRFNFLKVAILITLSFTFSAAQAASKWIRVIDTPIAGDGTHGVYVDSFVVLELERNGFFYLSSSFKEYYKAVGSSRSVLSLNQSHPRNKLSTIPLTNRAAGEYNYALEVCVEDDTGEEECFEYTTDTITVSLQKPSVPNIRSNRSTSTDGSYEIFWSDVANANTYEWSEKIGNGSWRKSYIYTAYEDEETLEEFEYQPNNTYSYRARACNDAGCSAYSTVTITVVIPTLDLPYAESFESNLGGWITTGSKKWSRDANGTPSGNTGPNKASSGSYYMYMETSGGAANTAGDTTVLTSPFFETTGTTITFDYHMYGSDIGTLSLEIEVKGRWTSIWSKSGQQHTSNSAAWSTASISLSDYLGLYQIRFRGLAVGGYRGDMAVDNVQILYVSDKRRKVTFIHTDLLGSPVAETDSNGVIQGAE